MLARTVSLSHVGIVSKKLNASDFLSPVVATSLIFVYQIWLRNSDGAIFNRIVKYTDGAQKIHYIQLISRWTCISETMQDRDIVTVVIVKCFNEIVNAE